MLHKLKNYESAYVLSATAPPQSPRPNHPAKLISGAPLLLYLPIEIVSHIHLYLIYLLSYEDLVEVSLPLEIGLER